MVNNPRIRLPRTVMLYVYVTSICTIITRYLGAFTMDAINGTAFGIDTDSQANPDHPLIDCANRIMGNKVRKGFTARVKSAFRIVVFSKYTLTYNTTASTHVITQQ